jgi:Rieske Fe-S protein
MKKQQPPSSDTSLPGDIFRSRRDFLRTALAVSVFSATYGTQTLLGNVLADDFKEIGAKLTGIYTLYFSEFPELRAVNGSIRLQVPGSSLSLGRVIVTRLSATELSALSENCTHGFCPVGPFTNGRFTCSCHGSIFDGKGNVVHDPAKIPLPSYPTTYKAGNDFVQIEIPGLVVASVFGDNQQGFSLAQNYPNPASGQTTIEYNVEKQSFITISLLSILGKEISELVKKDHEPGVYRIATDVSHLSRGVYLYRMETSTGYTQTRKLTVI